MRCLKVLAIGCFGVAVNAQAVDLMSVYGQALKSDPTFKKAHADWLDASRARTLASVGTGTAGSGLYPNITATGTFYRTRSDNVTVGQNMYFNHKTYTLTLNQPVLNWATWSSMRDAGLTVRGSYATYMAAGQDLMMRTAQAYLEILRANENLRYTISQKEAVRMELKTTLAQYRVGLVAVTGVYNSQSSYDQQIAAEISDRNSLHNKIEDLRAITGKFYQRFTVLPAALPTVVPAPANQAAWVNIATKHSYAIQADHFAMLAAKHSIQTNWAGIAPTVSAVANYQYDRYSAPYNSGAAKRTNAAYAGLSVTFPLFRGGYTYVMNDKLRAQYLSASDQLELTHRTTVNSTRQSFLSVQSGIAQINADYQNVLAAQKNLEATRKAYLVGTRVMTDVLKAISTLYDAKKTWAGHRYDYVEALLQLKENAGTLSANDLQTINNWMKRSAVMDYRQVDYTRDPYYHVAAIDLIRHRGSSAKAHHTGSTHRKKAKQSVQPKKARVKPRVKAAAQPKAVQRPHPEESPVFLPEPGPAIVHLPEPK